MTGQSLGAIVLAAITLAGCGEEALSGDREGGSPSATTKPLRMTQLRGTVVRIGSIHGEPLYGVRVRAFLCSRSAAEADRTFPTSFRIAHHVTAARATTNWPKPFRVMGNDLYWIVPLGETRATCGYVEFDDVIPPENYGGLESPLGCLGQCGKHRCYGIQLTLRAALLNGRRSTAMSASRRAIIQCGRFRLG
jgi:hypothetical protein